MASCAAATAQARASLGVGVGTIRTERGTPFSAASLSPALRYTEAALIKSLSEAPLPLAWQAEALLCRQYLGWKQDDRRLVESIGMLNDHRVNYDGEQNVYYWYYATQAAHHIGGEYWEKWNGRVRDLLIEFQDKGDDPTRAHQKGSWGPRGDAYAKQGGRLMYTSLALITLETYYYHIPLYGYGPAVLLD